MKKLYSVLGSFFIIAALIFLFVHTSLITKSPDESFNRDIFGFYIPTPPVWTSFIPVVGFLLARIFEYFSLHGVAGIVIMVVLIIIGGYFLQLEDKN